MPGFAESGEEAETGEGYVMSTVLEQDLLTAAQYFTLPDDGQHKELVRGRIVIMNAPGFRHGEVCGNIHYALRGFLAKRRLGRAVCNDTGVLTERAPDTVRGADVAYYSYQRVPRGTHPKRYAGAAPELVFEVLSPDDRWTKVLRKISEYLEAGVVVVCVADPERRTVAVYRANAPAAELSEEDMLTLPDVLPGFRISVKRLFED